MAGLLFQTEINLILLHISSIFSLKSPPTTSSFQIAFTLRPACMTPPFSKRLNSQSRNHCFPLCLIVHLTHACRSGPTQGSSHLLVTAEPAYLGSEPPISRHFYSKDKFSQVLFTVLRMSVFHSLTFAHAIPFTDFFIFACRNQPQTSLLPLNSHSTLKVWVTYDTYHMLYFIISSVFSFSQYQIANSLRSRTLPYLSICDRITAYFIVIVYNIDIQNQKEY